MPATHTISSLTSLTGQLSMTTSLWRPWLASTGQISRPDATSRNRLDPLWEVYRSISVASGNLEVGILMSVSHWPLDGRIEIIEETGKILKDPSTNSSMKEWALKERSEQKPPPMLSIHLSPAPLSMRSGSGFHTLPREGRSSSGEENLEMKLPSSTHPPAHPSIPSA